MRPSDVLTQPVAPAGGVTAEALVANPALLFQDPAALAELQRRLKQTLRVGTGGNPGDAIRGYVQSRMSLTGDPDGVMVVYRGQDPRAGSIVTDFFASRLQVSLPPARRSVLPPLGKQSVRVPWRAERLVPAAWMLTLSLFAICVLLAVVEWMDPSLKTVRQAARYLELPVLGVVPDLRRVNAAMEKKPSAASQKAKS